MVFYIGTKVDCDELEYFGDKMNDLPKAGIHTGEGRHVDMPSSWDGVGKVPPGWTSYRRKVLRHPIIDQYAVSIIETGDEMKLSAAERARLDLQRSLAVATLPADWIGATTESAISRSRR